MAIETVSFPIKNGDFPELCLFTRGYVFASAEIRVFFDYKEKLGVGSTNPKRDVEELRGHSLNLSDMVSC